MTATAPPTALLALYHHTPSAAHAGRSLDLVADTAVPVGIDVDPDGTGRIRCSVRWTIEGDLPDGAALLSSNGRPLLEYPMSPAAAGDAYAITVPDGLLTLTPGMVAVLRDVIAEAN